MCGLWGVVAKDQLTKEHFTLFQELGLVSTLRGYDSSGVALASKTKKGRFHYNWYKDVQAACNLVWDPAIADFFAKAKTPLVLMGHARWATIGAITPANAHPFRVVDAKGTGLLGMHNGTIPSLKEKDRTDSEVLYERIAKDGLEKTISNINGQKAYALTWFNLTDGTFNVLRNYDRTLYYMYSKDRTIMVYASDDAFLKLIAARYPTMTFGNPVAFEVDEHYRFKHGETTPTKERVCTFVPFVSGLPAIPWRNKGDPEKRALMEELQRELENTESGSKKEVLTIGKNSTASVSTVFGAAKELHDPRKMPPVPFPDTQGSDYLSIDRPAAIFRSKVVVLPMKIIINKVIKHLRYRMYDDRYVDPIEAIRILDRGCLFSGQKAKINDTIVWVSPDSFVMSEHSNIPFVTEALAAAGLMSPVYGEPLYASLPVIARHNAERKLPI